MSISDTRQAQKFASIAEVAAAETKLLLAEAEKAPEYANEARLYAEAASASASSAQQQAEIASSAASESVGAAQTAADDATTIINQQLTDQQIQFQSFLSSYGLQFIGDYEDGPFTFTARNQYIRYDETYWQVSSATNLPFTTTGTNSASWSNDLPSLTPISDDDALRSALAESSGARLIGATQGNLQDTIDYVYSGNGSASYLSSQLSSSTGSANSSLNRQSIARAFGAKTESVGSLSTSSAIDAYDLLYDPDTQLPFYRGSATGTPLSWTVANNVLTLTTSTGTFALVKADAGDRLKTVLATYIGSSMIGVQSIAGTLLGDVQAYLVEPTVEAFGAKGDNETIDDEAFAKAAKYSQDYNVIIRAKTGNKFLLTDTLSLVNRTSSTSSKSARFYGGSDVNTVLRFVNPSATTAAVSALGNTGISGANSAYNVHFVGFYLDCKEWGGDGILWKNIALWSLLARVQVWLPKGNGITANGYTDHVWNDVEVRGAGGYGILSYEPTVAVDGYFHEVSHMKFRNVNAFASNGYGVQWRVEGGNNLVFDNCKPSEGTVGLEFSRSIGNTILSTYVDGTTKATDSTQNIGIRINDSACRNFQIFGGRFVNIKYALYLVAGGYFNTSPWSLSYSNSTVGSDVYDIYIGSGVNTNGEESFFPTTSRILDNSAGMVAVPYSSRRVSFTSNLTNSGGSIGTGGSIVSTYRTNGKYVMLEILATVGTDSVLPTTYLGFTLPTNRLGTSGTLPLDVTLRRPSTNSVYKGVALMSSDFKSLTLLFTGVSTPGGLPITIASGDVIYVKGEYYRSV